MVARLIVSTDAHRVATVERNTRETQIHCRVDLDGVGRTRVDCAIGFLGHMLEALGRHAHIDLDLTVRGDLHVDQHHTVEDTAMVLGQALRQALGDRTGIWRTGWCRFPMDETLAECAIDIAGRPHLVFLAEFTRETVGELQADLVFEFFQAMAIALGCNIHLELVRGHNDHHRIEALFKAFARALELAVALHPRAAGEMPSTKGALDG
jgi:imidazoleglycerol-phosphate dehydratase